MNAPNKTQVRQLLTADIDAQIAALKEKRNQRATAGQAYVAALDDVDTRKAAVAAAQAIANDRKRDLIDLGLKPREISRLAADVREQNVKQVDSAGSDESPAPAAVGEMSEGTGMMAG